MTSEKNLEKTSSTDSERSIDEILELKKQITYLKNENTELTETLQRQSSTFIQWQASIQKQTDFIKSLLSSRQLKKFENFKEQLKGDENVDDIKTEIGVSQVHRYRKSLRTVALNYVGVEPT